MSVTRTYGLSGSGIDVDALVTKLMTAARTPYNKLAQQQTVATWKKEDYHTMYTSINEFNNTNVFNFNKQSTLAPKSVTSSNSTVATVTAKSDAANINHTLKVTQLASGVTESSSAAITTGTSKTTLATQFDLAGGSFDIKINNTSITVKTTGSINDLVSSINNASAGVTANYDTTTDRFYLSSNTTGASAGIDFTGTSPYGLAFLSDNLKMAAYGNVDNIGIGSSVAVGINQNASLQSQFSGLSSSLNLNISDGTTNKTLTIDTTNNSIDNVISQINGIKNANGAQMAVASFVDGKFTLKSNTATSLDISGSDAAAIGFLNTQLRLPVTAATTIDRTGVSATVFDETAKLSTQFLGLSGSFDMKISDGDTTSTVTINTATDSMDDIITNINNLKDSSGKQLATASFTNGKFTIKAYSSDANLSLSSSDTAGTSFLNNRLKLISKTGQDAQIKLDGVNMTQSSNKFTVAGVTYNALSTGSSTVGITTDVTSIVSNVKAFVAAYNTMLGSVNGEINETRYTSYAPLTDDQKTSMKDADVSLWTVKAKSGMLHNDSILKTLSDSMRSAFSTPVSGLTGTYKTASSLGITTSSDYTENGKLYLDETVLTKALEADPNAAYKIFGTTGTTTATNGIATRLGTIMKTATASIVTTAGATAATTTDKTSSLGKSLHSLSERMSTMSDFLVDEESRYYKKFSAMETALAKLSSQSSSVTSLLNSGSSG